MLLLDPLHIPIVMPKKTNTEPAKKVPAKKAPAVKVPAAKVAKVTGDKAPVVRKNVGGRPSKYTPELAREICKQLVQGKSLKKICAAEGMPYDSTVRDWIIDDREGFHAQYMRAIQARAITWGEEILEVADDGSNDTFKDPNTGQERVNAEVVARSRLRVDTRKWLLSKMLPKIYADKIDVNHGVQPENPLASLVQRIAGTGLPIVKTTDSGDDE
jgi:hypothetical protein